MRAKRILRPLLPGAMATLLALALHAPGAKAQEPPASGGKPAAAKRISPRLGALRRARTRSSNNAPEIGTASWYGPGFHGKRTASGRDFDAAALSAAHPWLPLGTKVRVQLVGSDRFVDVTITDRTGKTTRVIDLSPAAARKLGILSRGTAQVAVEPL
jgi:rare lipoprotein A (peptidoglycan hydrolase)